MMGRNGSLLLKIFLNARLTSSAPKMTLRATEDPYPAGEIGLGGPGFGAGVVEVVDDDGKVQK